MGDGRMSTLKVNALQDTSGVGFYPARAWVNFNGVGTVSIRDDKNVSSLTDNSSGNYTVNFSNSVSNNNYCCNFSATDNGTGPDQTDGYAYGSWSRGSTAVVYATGSMRVGLGYPANYLSYDQTHINISIVGD